MARLFLCKAAFDTDEIRYSITFSIANELNWWSFKTDARSYCFFTPECQFLPCKCKTRPLSCPCSNIYYQEFIMGVHALIKREYSLNACTSIMDSCYYSATVKIRVFMWPAFLVGAHTNAPVWLPKGVKFEVFTCNLRVLINTPYSVYEPVKYSGIDVLNRKSMITTNWLSCNIIVKQQLIDRC